MEGDDCLFRPSMGMVVLQQRVPAASPRLGLGALCQTRSRLLRAAAPCCAIRLQPQKSSHSEIVYLKLTFPVQISFRKPYHIPRHSGQGTSYQLHRRHRKIPPATTFAYVKTPPWPTWATATIHCERWRPRKNSLSCPKRPQTSRSRTTTMCP